MHKASCRGSCRPMPARPLRPPCEGPPGVRTAVFSQRSSSVPSGADSSTRKACGAWEGVRVLLQPGCARGARPAAPRSRPATHLDDCRLQLHNLLPHIEHGGMRRLHAALVLLRHAVLLAHLQRKRKLHLQPRGMMWDGGGVRAARWRCMGTGMNQGRVRRCRPCQAAAQNGSTCTLACTHRPPHLELLVCGGVVLSRHNLPHFALRGCKARAGSRARRQQALSTRCTGRQGGPGAGANGTHDTRSRHGTPLAGRAAHLGHVSHCGSLAARFQCRRCCRRPCWRCPR